jgi:hypothetical protein
VYTLLLLYCLLAVARHQPIPNPLPADLGPNFFGYIAIFTLTVSLISSTMFSEAVWQRVWASATPRALYGGAFVGFVSITIIVFLSGFGGWLAFIWGYASFEAGTNPNVYLMQVRLTATIHFMIWLLQLWPTYAMPPDRIVWYAAASVSVFYV